MLLAMPKDPIRKFIERFKCPETTKRVVRTTPENIRTCNISKNLASDFRNRLSISSNKNIVVLNA